MKCDNTEHVKSVRVQNRCGNIEDLFIFILTFRVINIIKTCVTEEIKGSIVCAKIHSLWDSDNKHVGYSLCVSLPAVKYLTDLIELCRL
jgi:D-mannonate dehydratase